MDERGERETREEQEEGRDRGVVLLMFVYRVFSQVLRDGKVQRGF